VTSPDPITNPGVDMDRTICIDRDEPETRIRALADQVAQLESENILLEETLQRNNRMFAALLRNCQHGITLTGPDRRIVRVIKGLTGIDPTSLQGQLIESLAIPEDRQTIVDAYRTLLSGDCARLEIVVRVPRADGTIAVHMATLTDMLDDTNVQGIVWNYSAQTLALKSYNS
jgi:PAS domain-containing protein